jgi:hypothetical protein
MVRCRLGGGSVNLCFSLIVCYAVLTGRLKRFKRSWCPFVRGQARSLLGRLNSEDKDTASLRNVRNYLPVDVTS